MDFCAGTVAIAKACNSYLSTDDLWRGEVDRFHFGELLAKMNKIFAGKVLNE